MKMRIRGSLGWLGAALAAATLAGCAALQVDVRDRAYFPLGKGDCWNYEGLVIEQMGNPAVVTTNGMQLFVSVLDVVERDGITAALLSGFPESSMARTMGIGRWRVLLRTMAGRYHLLTGDRWDEITGRLRDPKDVLVGLVDSETLLIDGPLLVGRRYGPERQITRADRAYSWHVVGEEDRRLPDIAGIPHGRSYAESVISRRTVADTQTFGFTPGVGITWYEYASAQTASRVTFFLRGYERGGRQSRSDAKE